MGKLKIEIEDLIRLKEIAGALIRKEDPRGYVSFAEDTVLAIPEVEKYNQEIYSLLEQLLKMKYQEMSWREKNPFFLTKEQKSNIIVSEEPISISKLCYSINEMIPGDMRRLRAIDLLDGLEEMGYLYTVEENTAFVRRPTEMGIELGIEVAERENKFQNKYLVNLYNADAQRFVVENLDKLIWVPSI